MMMHFKLLTPEHLDLYLEHLVRHFAEPSVNGTLAHPYPLNQVYDSQHARPKLLRTWQQPLEQGGWERCWGLFDGDKVVGHLNLKGHSHVALRHRARLGIGFEVPYRSQGWGNKLLTTAVEWAKQQNQLTWIDLSVFSENKAAITFYQNHGFKTLTVIPDQLRVDGQSIDDVQMVLDLRSIQQTASIPTNESSSLQVFGRLGPEHLEALKHIELRSKSEKFSHSAVLTDLIGFNDLFVHHEIIPPGRRASSPHRHSHIEELFLVLKGHPTFHCGEQSWKVAPGAFIGFRPDQQDLHYVSNDSDEDVHLLGMSSDHPLDETIY